jgi:hypothetical protein
MQRQWEQKEIKTIPPKEQNLRLLAWLSRISIPTFVCHHFQPMLMAGTWITYRDLDLWSECFYIGRVR